MDEFDEICRRCTPVVYRFLLSLCKDASLADELTAETFYQAYLHIDTFRGNCRVESRRPLRGNARACRAGRHF